MERMQLPVTGAMEDLLKSAGLSNLTCEELARLQVGAMNRAPGKLTGLDCPECQNRGYFVRLDEQYRRYNVECRCMAQRRSLERVARSGLGNLLEHYTLESWQAREPWQKRAKELTLQYAGNPDGKWFCVTGAVGAGKSHLCTALAGLLMERGYDVLYMLWRDTVVRAKAVVNDDEAYRRIVAPLKHVRVLYIDDFLKVGRGGRPTEADVTFASEILNARYCNQELLTIISSERSVEEILDIDESVGSRIYQRSRGYYIPLAKMKNWRLQ